MQLLCLSRNDVLVWQRLCAVLCAPWHWCDVLVWQPCVTSLCGSISVQSCVPSGTGGSLHLTWTQVSPPPPRSVQVAWLQTEGREPEPPVSWSCVLWGFKPPQNALSYLYIWDLFGSKLSLWVTCLSWRIFRCFSIMYLCWMLLRRSLSWSWTLIDGLFLPALSA